MKNLYLLLMLCLTFSAFTSTADAQWWSDKELAGKMTLTEAQAKEFDTLLTDFQAKRKELHVQAQKADEKIREMLGAETLDEKGITDAVKESGNLRAQIMQEEVTMKLAIRKALKPEQLKTLVTERPGVFSKQANWMKTSTPKGSGGKPGEMNTWRMKEKSDGKSSPTENQKTNTKSNIKPTDSDKKPE